MEISILSPDKEIFHGHVSSVKVPGAAGQFQILKNHAAIVSALIAGTVEVTTEAQEKLQWTIEKGFVEVLQNQISVLVQGLKE